MWASKGKEKPRNMKKSILLLKRSTPLKKIIQLIIGLAFILLILPPQSCTQETQQIAPIHLKMPGQAKQKLKSEAQFISIAYSDLTGKTIEAGELETLVALYQSVGDKGLVGGMILKRLFKNPKVDFPADSQMRQNPENFVLECYQRFYNRQPDALETWYLDSLIRHDENRDLSPEKIWFEMMTSEEYRNF